MINHNDMVRTLAKSGTAILETMLPSTIHLLHMAVGISGEVAELTDAILQKDRVNQVEEFGDVEFYFTGICQGLGMQSPIGHTVVVVIAKGVYDPMAETIITAGDVLDFTKKIAVYNDPSKKEGLEQALYVFRTKLDNLYAETGITREEAIEGNIAKLGDRYKGFQYSDKAAQQRADKA